MSTVEAVVTCDLRVFRCRCVKPVGHVDEGDEVHACDAGCGGSWRGESEETMEVVSLPYGIGGGLHQ